MASLQTYLSSTAASFSSPDMDQGSFGILIQITGENQLHGTPTWNGVNMTLAVREDENPSKQGSLSIWHVTGPVPSGVTTIVRGANVGLCFALKARGVQLFGDPVRDTDRLAGGLGGWSMSVGDVSTGDFLLSLWTLDTDEYVNPVASGAQNIEASGSNISCDYYWGYAVSQSGTVNLGWDISDTCNGASCCVAFKGGVHRAGTIVFG